MTDDNAAVIAELEAAIARLTNSPRLQNQYTAQKLKEYKQRLAEMKAEAATAR